MYKKQFYNFAMQKSALMSSKCSARFRAHEQHNLSRKTCWSVRDLNQTGFYSGFYCVSSQFFRVFLPRLFTYIALISLPTHASLAHRMKNIRRYNCIGQSRYAMRNDIFQNITVPDKKCRKRCYEFKHNITYAVIMVKEVVLSCRDSNRLPP